MERDIPHGQDTTGLLQYLLFRRKSQVGPQEISGVLAEDLPEIFYFETSFPVTRKIIIGA
jgi:hypothetical protein